MVHVVYFSISYEHDAAVEIFAHAHLSYSTQVDPASVIAGASSMIYRESTIIAPQHKRSRHLPHRSPRNHARSCRPPALSGRQVCAASPPLVLRQRFLFAGSRTLSIGHLVLISCSKPILIVLCVFNLMYVITLPSCPSMCSFETTRTNKLLHAHSRSCRWPIVASSASWIAERLPWAISPPTVRRADAQS